LFNLINCDIILIQKEIYISHIYITSKANIFQLKVMINFLPNIIKINAINFEQLYSIFNNLLGLRILFGNIFIILKIALFIRWFDLLNLFLLIIILDQL